LCGAKSKIFHLALANAFYVAPRALLIGHGSDPLHSESRGLLVVCHSQDPAAPALLSSKVLLIAAKSKYLPPLWRKIFMLPLFYFSPYDYNI
jgi:hypothetical protein